VFWTHGRLQRLVARPTHLSVRLFQRLRFTPSRLRREVALGAGLALAASGLAVALGVALTGMLIFTGSWPSFTEDRSTEAALPAAVSGARHTRATHAKQRAAVPAAPAAAVAVAVVHRPAAAASVPAKRRAKRRSTAHKPRRRSSTKVSTAPAPATPAPQPIPAPTPAPAPAPAPAAQPETPQYAAASVEQAPATRSKPSTRRLSATTVTTKPTTTGERDRRHRHDAGRPRRERAWEAPPAPAAPPTPAPQPAPPQPAPEPAAPAPRWSPPGDDWPGRDRHGDRDWRHGPRR
jgi:hypothetical protein